MRPLLKCLALAPVLALPLALYALPWPLPTPQELTMTAPPEDPGASAVYLSFDEDDSDQYNVHTITVRLKVLT